MKVASLGRFEISLHEVRLPLGNVIFARDRSLRKPSSVIEGRTVNSLMNDGRGSEVQMKNESKYVES